MLRSCIAQLHRATSTSRKIEEEYEKRENHPIEIQECSQLLASLVTEQKKTTFFIDALDECENADELLLHLKELPEKSVKLFFSSRNQVEVRRWFPKCDKMELDSSKDLRAKEMETYVKTQVKDREKLKLGSCLLKGTDPELEDRLIEVLLDHAQGMYVIYDCHFNNAEALI